MSETIILEPLTRLEGNGRVKIDIEGGFLKNLQFSVMTGPRFFEQLLLNKPAEEAPRITERICGICYVNHHLVSVKAVEDAWGVEPPEVAQILRRTLNAASFVTSHALHLAFLALPDLMDLPDRSFIGIIKANPALADIGIKLHEFGNNVVQAIGGRVVHVVTAVPGGQTSGLTGEARYRLLRESRIAINNVRKVADAVFQIFENRSDDPEEYQGAETNYMGLVNDGKYEIYDGELRTKEPNGDILCQFKPQDYREYIEETTSDHSYTKIPYMKSKGCPGGLGRVGPLGRINVIDSFKWPISQEYLRSYEKIFGRPSHDTAAYNLARTVEFVAAVEEVVEGLSNDMITSDRTRVPVKARAGVGTAITEAPRGVLLHNYKIDERGLIKGVNIIAPTTFNHLNIENNLKRFALANVDSLSEKGTRETALWGIEKIVRAYDPCLSCSVHLVDVDLTIDGAYVPTRREN
ncbi:MAG TPA: Ni/Fe hydrogenase subunit alpha [Patescibacteria group bacterium]|nr:Ni/Fe hydrogenase subunit alpha [Patescibacteria group bacterium]